MIDAKHPDTLLVMDEAYYEYAISGDYFSGHNLLEATNGNWIILRTFSKAWGLAGLRIGFGICSSKALRAALDLTRAPFNINAVAQMAAVAALKAQEYMNANIVSAESERSRVAKLLRGLSFKVAPSLGNFLFFDTQQSSKVTAERLLVHGTIVKPWKQDGFSTFIRVSIGSEQENNKFIDDITRVAEIR